MGHPHAKPAVAASIVFLLSAVLFLSAPRAEPDGVRRIPLPDL